MAASVHATLNRSIAMARPRYTATGRLWPTRHGMYTSSEYSCWKNMKARCQNQNNPAYHNYGGRGITVCEAWKKFEAFYSDMGPCPDGMWIERVDNNGNYEPDNCTWTARTTNQRNRRKVWDSPKICAECDHSFVPVNWRRPSSHTFCCSSCYHTFQKRHGSSMMSPMMKGHHQAD